MKNPFKNILKGGDLPVESEFTVIKNTFSAMLDQVNTLKDRLSNERSELVTQIKNAKEDLQTEVDRLKKRITELERETDSFIRNIRSNVHDKDAQLETARNLAKALVPKDVEETEKPDLTKPVKGE